MIKIRIKMRNWMTAFQTAADGAGGNHDDGWTGKAADSRMAWRGVRAFVWLGGILGAGAQPGGECSWGRDSDFSPRRRADFAEALPGLPSAGAGGAFFVVVVRAGAQAIFGHRQRHSGSTDATLARLDFHRRTVRRARVLSGAEKKTLNEWALAKCPAGDPKAAPPEKTWNSEWALGPPDLMPHLLSVIPHMHWLGKDFLLEAVLPDGTRRTLIKIDQWDFNWQGTYEFARRSGHSQGHANRDGCALRQLEGQPQKPQQSARRNALGGTDHRRDVHRFFAAYAGR